MEAGLYSGLSFEGYRATDALSISTLKVFAKAPAKLLAEEETSRAATLGSLTHTATLEPDALDARFRVGPDARGNSNAWKAALAEAEADGVELIRADDWRAALAMRDAVLKHPVASALLSGPGLVEASAFWEDPLTGVPCRARPDRLCESSRVIVDVKTAADGSPWEFARAAARMKYHWQAASYLDAMRHLGWEPAAFVFLVVEKDAPFIVSAYELEREALEAGRRQVADALAYYAECRRENRWPGYVEGIAPLALPSYALH